MTFGLRKVNHVRSLALGDGVQRIGFLIYLPLLLRRFGVEPNEVLVSTGLAQDALDNPENTISIKLK
jgi:hypothetical protein